MRLSASSSSSPVARLLLVIMLPPPLMSASRSSRCRCSAASLSRRASASLSHTYLQTSSHSRLPQSRPSAMIQWHVRSSDICWTGRPRVDACPRGQRTSRDMDSAERRQHGQRNENSSPQLCNANTKVERHSEAAVQELCRTANSSPAVGTAPKPPICTAMDGGASPTSVPRLSTSARTCTRVASESGSARRGAAGHWCCSESQTHHVPHTPAMSLVPAIVLVRADPQPASAMGLMWGEVLDALLTKTN